MARPDVSKILSSSFEIFKKNPLTYVIAWILLTIVNACTFGILFGPLLVGYFRMVKIDADGGKASIGDLFKGFDSLAPGLVAGLLSLVIIGVGSMLCVLPGLVAAPLLPLSLYLVAEGEQDGVNALKRAWHAMSPHIIESVVYMLILGIIAFAGMLLCCIGLFVTIPIGFIGQYWLARQLTNDGAVQ